jgi:hypothetical protein
MRSHGIYLRSLEHVCRLIAAAMVVALMMSTGSLAEQDESAQEKDSSKVKIEPVPEKGTNALPGILPPDVTPMLSAEQPIRVEQKLDKTIITVGDLITYTMTVEAAEGMEIALPPPGAQLGNFIIRDYHIPDPQKQKDRIIHKYIFTITAYTTGHLEVPPIPVLINPETPNPRAIITEGIQVRVAPVTNPEDLQIRDVKNPLAIPLDWKPYIIAAAGAIAIIGLIISIVLYIQRYRPKEAQLPEPVKPAHQIAYQELRELDSMGLLEAGQVEEYCTRLSEIIRRYIALRFRIYALEYTTTEILKALKGKPMENRVYERIKWFLQETDLVKFARHIPHEKDQSEIMDRARQIIDWSREKDTDILAEAGQNMPPKTADQKRAQAI